MSISEGEFIIKSLPSPVLGNAGAVKVYPNPSNGQFTVQVPQTGNDATITIVDVLGRVVATRNVEETKAKSSAQSFSGIPGGCYVVKVSSGNKSYQMQVVVSR